MLNNKYLWLLMLPVLFFLAPVKTDALGIDFTNSQGAVVGSCSNCSNNEYISSNLMQDVTSFHIYFGNEFTFYQNYKYDIKIKFRLYSNTIGSLVLGNPLFCIPGYCPNLNVNEYSAGGGWSYTDEFPFFPSVVGLTISGDFTMTMQGTSGYLEFNPRSFNFYGIRILEYSVSTLSDDTGAIINNSSNQIIQNNKENTQNIINNQNSNQQQTNEKLDKLEQSIINDDVPSLDAIEDSSGWLPPGPVDSILNLPLTFLNNLISNLSKTCSPVSIPIPFVNQNFQLPCISTLYDSMGITTFVNWVGLISGTLILYYYLLSLYKWVDNTIQLKDNNDWGGV